MIKSDTVGKLFQALATAQATFGPVLREKENPGFRKEVGGVKYVSKYADLDAAIKATQPALIQNGLVISQFPINTDTRVGVLSILGHISGEFIGQEYTLPIFKQDAQTGVAGITYARRAARLAIVDVAAEDDDGNTAAGRKIDDESQQAVRNESGGPINVPQVSVPQAQIPKDVTFTQTTVVTGIPKSGGPLPTDPQFDEYVKRLAALRTKLEAEGGLKASRGLPSPRKMLNYIKQVTETDDLKKISVTQFDAFLSFAEKAEPVELVKLINGGTK